MAFALLAQAAERVDVDRLLQALLEKVYKRRIRLKERFGEFDPLRAGKVTIHKFRTALTVAGLDDLAEREYAALAERFAAPPARDGMVAYGELVALLDRAFVVPDMERDPTATVTPLTAAAIRKPLLVLSAADEALCAAVLARIARQVALRRLEVKQPFDDFAHDDNSAKMIHRVTRAQFRQVLGRLQLELSNAEAEALMAKFNTHNDGGVNYIEFAVAVDPTVAAALPPALGGSIETAAFKSGFRHEHVASAATSAYQPGRPPVVADAPRLPARAPPDAAAEGALACVLARCAELASTYRIRLADRFADYDRLRANRLPVETFRAALCATYERLPLELAEAELVALAEAFGTRLPDGGAAVAWRAFVAAVDARVQGTVATDAADPHAVPKPPASCAADKLRPPVAGTEGAWVALSARLRGQIRERRGIFCKPTFADFAAANNSQRLVDHVTRSQFGQGLSSVGLRVSAAELELLVHRFDTKRDGTVHYVLFCSGAWAAAGAAGLGESGGGGGRRAGGGDGCVASVASVALVAICRSLPGFARARVPARASRVAQSSTSTRPSARARPRGTAASASAASMRPKCCRPTLQCPLVPFRSRAVRSRSATHRGCRARTRWRRTSRSCSPTCAPPPSALASARTRSLPVRAPARLAPAIARAVPPAEPPAALPPARPCADYDRLHSRRLPATQFKAALRCAFEKRLALSEPQLASLISAFSKDGGLTVSYKDLADAVSATGGPGALEAAPLHEPVELHASASHDLAPLPPDQLALVDAVLDRFRSQVVRRSLAVKPAMRDFEKSAKSPMTVDRITREQFRRALAVAGLEASNPEFAALAARLDTRRDGTVDFCRFAALVDPAAEAAANRSGTGHGLRGVGGYHHSRVIEPAVAHAYQPGRPPTTLDQPRLLETPAADAAELLARMRARVQVLRLGVDGAFRDADRLNSGTVSIEVFRSGIARAFDTARLALTEGEFAMLVERFARPRPAADGGTLVDWRAFVAEVDPIVVGLERDPLAATAVPRQPRAVRTLSAAQEAALGALVARLRLRFQTHRVLLKPFFLDFAQSQYARAGPWVARARAHAHPARP